MTNYEKSQSEKILKSFGIDLDLTNNIEKGKEFPVGTVHNGYKKIANGNWKKVSEHGYTSVEHYHLGEKELSSKTDNHEYDEDFVLGKYNKALTLNNEAGTKLKVMDNKFFINDKILNKYKELLSELKYTEQQKNRTLQRFGSNPQSPGGKDIIRGVLNEYEKAKNNIETFLYNRSGIKNILKDLGISASKTSATRIRGINNYSTGYYFDKNYPQKISLTGINKDQFDKIKNKLIDSGFNIEKEDEPYKGINGTFSSISIKKFYNDLKINE